jgi:microcystin-dependent protein
VTSRKVFQDGDIFYAEDANILGYPIVDGQDILGHGAKVSDTFLDDAPNQIKARFYTWYNRFRVTPGTGLNVDVTNGLVNAGGTVINIPPQSLVVADNSTSFIWIGRTVSDSAIALRQSLSLPSDSIPLARVVSSSGTVIGVTDLRDVTVDYLPPSIPDAVPVGSFITSLLPPSRPVPNGYIELQDNPIQVSRVVYANLFTEFGTYYGAGDGTTTFTLPGKGNRYIRLSSSGMTPGTTGGSNQISITTNNLPPHNHPIQDLPHNHGVNNPPHNHGVTDGGHGHSISDPGHIHGTPLHQEGGSGAFGGRDFQNSAPGTFNTGLSGTGININPNTSNVSVNLATTNVTLNPSSTGLTQTQNTGSGTPMTHEPSYITVRVFVKF